MASKKKAAPAHDTLVAKVSIAIEGKHFAAGTPIEGVSDEELRRAVAVRRVVTFADFKGNAAPESEADPADAEPSTDDQAEA